MKYINFMQPNQHVWYSATLYIIQQVNQCQLCTIASSYHLPLRCHCYPNLVAPPKRRRGGYPQIMIQTKHTQMLCVWYIYLHFT